MFPSGEIVRVVSPSKFINLHFPINTSFGGGTAVESVLLELPILYETGQGKGDGTHWFDENDEFICKAGRSSGFCTPIRLVRQFRDGARGLSDRHCSEQRFVFACWPVRRPECRYCRSAYSNSWPRV